MTQRVLRVVVMLSITAGMLTTLSPAARATKVLERYKGTTKELKTECGDQGGSFIGSKSGKQGVCVWDDGTFTSCDNTKKGKNCNTQGRVVTAGGEFLDFVEVGVADPSTVTVVPTDHSAAGGGTQVKRLLAKDRFAMTLQQLENVCDKVAKAALIESSDGSQASCMGNSVTLFCNLQKSKKNCDIEATLKLARGPMQLLRKALVHPSSVVVVVASDGGTPSSDSGAGATPRPPGPTGSDVTTTTSTAGETTTTSAATTTTAPSPTTTRSSTTTTQAPAFL